MEFSSGNTTRPYCLLVTIISGNGLWLSGNKSLPESMWNKFFWLLGVTRPQWLNKLYHFVAWILTDDYINYDTTVTSAKSLAGVSINACLTAPSYFLEQCWLLIGEVLWHLPESNFTATAQTTILFNKFKYFAFEITIGYPRGQWVQTPLIEN